jgi:hypothetical protein
MTRVPVTRPSPEFVDFYAGHIRARVKSLADLAHGLHHALGMGHVETVVSAGWCSDAERTARIAAIVAAVEVVAAEIRASLAYQREQESVVVPGPRLPLHVGVVEDSGRLGSARLRALPTAGLRELV